MRSLRHINIWENHAIKKDEKWNGKSRERSRETYVRSRLCIIEEYLRMYGVPFSLFTARWNSEG